MDTTRLDLTRDQILAFRRRVGALDERLPAGTPSLRRAAWAGLQDSMPRAALLSIHARVASTDPGVLDDPSLVQLWGPRFSVFVVAAEDVSVFSLGRLPEGARARHRAQDLAAQLQSLLGDSEMAYGDAGRALGRHPNELRYATTTGTILLRWDGAAKPLIRSVPAADVDPRSARLELARRYLHVYGPTTADSFIRWAGIERRAGAVAFESLTESLTPVRTPVGDAWILADDEPTFRSPPEPPAPARLLSSGDPYYLLRGDDRTLLVPDSDLRDRLWTSRVWPGAVLADGEIVGTWRRTRHVVTIQPWGRLSTAVRQAVEREVSSLPLPGVDGEIDLRWD